MNVFSIVFIAVVAGLSIVSTVQGLFSKKKKQKKKDEADEALQMVLCMELDNYDPGANAFDMPGCWTECGGTCHIANRRLSTAAKEKYTFTAKPNRSELGCKKKKSRILCVPQKGKTEGLEDFEAGVRAQFSGEQWEQQPAPQEQQPQPQMYAAQPQQFAYAGQPQPLMYQQQQPQPTVPGQEQPQQQLDGTQQEQQQQQQPPQQQPIYPGQEQQQQQLYGAQPHPQQMMYPGHPAYPGYRPPGWGGAAAIVIPNWFAVAVLAIIVLFTF